MAPLLACRALRRSDGGRGERGERSGAQEVVAKGGPCHVCMFVHVYLHKSCVCMHASLSLYIYICIHINICIHIHTEEAGTQDLTPGVRMKPEACQAL